MYKRITKYQASEISMQIKIAKLYSHQYAKKYGKNEKDKLISILKREGLNETAAHVEFLTYGAMTMGELLTLPQSPVPVKLAERTVIRDMIDCRETPIRFERNQLYHLKEEDKALCIDSVTCHLYVCSFRQNWNLALLEQKGSFNLTQWVSVFPLGIWGIYSPQPGEAVSLCNLAELGYIDEKAELRTS